MSNQNSRAIDFIFFDIGGTLGDRDPQTGKLVLFASTLQMLVKFRDVFHVPMGLITTLGGLSRQDGLALVQEAGLSDFFDSNGFVCEHDNHGVSKPSPDIYQFAARQVAVPINRCLFVGENLIEVAGAITAGMQGLLKPCPPGRDLA